MIKAKQQKNARENEKPHENGKISSDTGTHGRAWRMHDRAPPTTGRAGPHDQPVVGFARSGPSAPTPLHFVLSSCFDLGREFCLCWVILGLLCYPLWSTWPSTSLFLLFLGLTHMNLQSKLEEAETSVIRENRGVNHINIYLNPLKWILNTQLILCKDDTYQTSLSWGLNLPWLTLPLASKSMKENLFGRI